MRVRLLQTAELLFLCRRCAYCAALVLSDRAGRSQATRCTCWLLLLKAHKLLRRTWWTRCAARRYIKLLWPLRCWCLASPTVPLTVAVCCVQATCSWRGALPARSEDTLPLGALFCCGARLLPSHLHC